MSKNLTIYENLPGEYVLIELARPAWFQNKNGDWIPAKAGDYFKVNLNNRDDQYPVEAGTRMTMRKKG